MFHKQKKTSSFGWSSVHIISLNDEHQGEGGTLVFIDANNTIRVFIWQEF
jgi:hypothetical protein